MMVVDIIVLNIDVYINNENNYCILIK